MVWCGVVWGEAYPKGAVQGETSVILEYKIVPRDIFSCEYKDDERTAQEWQAAQRRAGFRHHGDIPLIFTFPKRRSSTDTTGHSDKGKCNSIVHAVCELLIYCSGGRVVTRKPVSESVRSPR